MEIEQSLHTYLEGFLSCSVYPGMRPQDTALPAVSYSRTSGGYQADLAGAINFTDPYFEVVIYSDSFAECITTAETIREKMQYFSGTLSSRIIHVVLLTDESDQYYKPVNATSSGIFTTTQTYHVVYQEN